MRILAIPSRIEDGNTRSLFSAVPVLFKKVLRLLKEFAEPFVGAKIMSATGFQAQSYGKSYDA